MATIAGRRLIGKAGAASINGCKLLIVSQYSNTVALVIDGQSIPSITLTVMGTDVPADVSLTEAGYYAHYDIVGLTDSNTSYPYTLTQAGTPGGTVIFNGTLMTSPTETDDFTLFMYSCSGGIQNDSINEYPGGWDYVKRYADKALDINPGSLPISAIIGVDDTCYGDSFSVDDSANTGHKTHDQKTETADATTEYDACLRWMIWAGMVDTDAGTRINDAKEINHSWCNDNINQILCWGDHEVFNDVGYGLESATRRLGGSGAQAFQTVQLFEHLETAYDIFCHPLNGTPLDDGVPLDGSRGTHLTYGPLHFIFIDRNYGDGSNREGNGSFLFSQKQLDGATAALSGSNSEFRIIGSASTYYDGLPTDIWSLDQNAVTELFTNEVDSLTAKEKADGNRWFMFNGDLHVVHSATFNAKVPGQLQENFKQFSVSTMCVPNSLLVPAEIQNEEAKKGWYDRTLNAYLSGTGVDKDWLMNFDYSLIEGYPATSGDYFDAGLGQCVKVEVFGSESPKRMVVSIVNSNSHIDDYTATYLHGSIDNLPIEEKIMANLKFSTADQVLDPTGNEIIGASSEDPNVPGTYLDKGIRLGDISAKILQQYNESLQTASYFSFSAPFSNALYLTGGTGTHFMQAKINDALQPAFASTPDGERFTATGFQGTTRTLKGQYCEMPPTANNIRIYVLVYEWDNAGSQNTMNLVWGDATNGPGIDFGANQVTPTYWTWTGAGSYMTWNAQSMNEGQAVCVLRAMDCTSGAQVGKQVVHGATQGSFPSAGAYTGGDVSADALTDFTMPITNTAGGYYGLYGWINVTSMPSDQELVDAAQWMAENPEAGMYPGFSTLSSI